MQGLNLAELLLLVIVLQQGVAAPIWWACARVGVAPRVPGLHWAAGAAWASVSLGLTLFASDPWYAHGLANMLAPGIFLLLAPGPADPLSCASPRWREPDGDPARPSAGRSAVSWPARRSLGAVWLSSLLNAYCLWRAAQVVGPLAREELGELPAKLLVWPLARDGPAVHGAPAAWAWSRSTETAVYLNQATTANLIVLALLMTFGLLLHLTLGLAIALRLMARLRQLTRSDSLTGLPNRRAADEMIEQLREAQAAAR